jgi:REP element-mobilizing transposase RayT
VSSDTYREGVAPLRQIDPEGLYHVMSRGNYRAKVFIDEDHYVRYLSLLQRVAKRRQWMVLDWCLMPNHFHLVIQLTEGGLSEGMRELNGCFSRWSNERTGRTGTGHLWKNRFTCRDIVREGHLWAVFQYVPLNPVAADLSKLPEDWPWCGYRATIGAEYPFRFHRPDELLRHFATQPQVALRRYRDFVHEGLVRIGESTWSDQGEASPPPALVVESAA